MCVNIFLFVLSYFVFPLCFSKEKKKYDELSKVKESLEQEVSGLNETIAQKELESNEQLEAIESLKEDVEQCREEIR